MKLTRNNLEHLVKEILSDILDEAQSAMQDQTVDEAQAYTPPSTSQEAEFCRQRGFYEVQRILGNLSQFIAASKGKYPPPRGR